MAFTFNRTDFVNFRSYNEKEHAKALRNGFINFIGQGLEYNGVDTVTSGKGINEGVPFELGRPLETQAVTPLFTGFLVVKSTLNGLSSVSELQELVSIPASTDNIKYFGIYELNNGAVVNDLRHIDYIKSLEVVAVPPDQFAIVINGFQSNPFDSGTITDVYRMVQDFTGLALVPLSVDVDTIIESGHYNITGGINLHPEISNVGVLTVIDQTGTKINQSYQGDDDHIIIRKSNDGGTTWSDWRWVTEKVTLLGLSTNGVPMNVGDVFNLNMDTSNFKRIILHFQNYDTSGFQLVSGTDLRTIELNENGVFENRVYSFVTVGLTGTTDNYSEKRLTVGAMSLNGESDFGSTINGGIINSSLRTRLVKVLGIYK